ncbi:MAG: hypothetical protein U0527_00430 [Candidatus Eisenbacteria bacterium]
MKRWGRFLAIVVIQLALLGLAFERHASLERSARSLILQVDECWMGRDFGGGFAYLSFSFDWPSPQPRESSLEPGNPCWAIFAENSPAWSLVDVRKRESGSAPPAVEANQIALEGSYGGEAVYLIGTNRLRVDDRDYQILEARLAPERGADAVRTKPSRPDSVEQRPPRPFRSVEARVVRGRILSFRALRFAGEEFGR